ncbi:MAG: biopolymer transporter ExbD [Chitinophagaceae bacterium]|nr:biopolymer transporter ExbD [Chitinophagaceae bacterium]
MSSIDTGGDDGHKKGPGVKKAKKLSTRVDMTPMVDLGFLLITFFIFTATMSSPVGMDLNMPKDTDKPEEETEIKQSGALTIMLGKDNHVYYYEGQLTQENASTAFKSSSFDKIRDIIINKKKDVISSYRGNPACEQKARDKGKDPKAECIDEDFVVVIKPTAEATYKNTVDILDEMTINNVKRFAMVKISDTEKEMIAKTEGGQ